MLTPFKKKEGVPLTVLKWEIRFKIVVHGNKTQRFKMFARHLLQPYFHETRVAKFVSVLFIPERNVEGSMPVACWAHCSSDG
jgi:hypothetical protein